MACAEFGLGPQLRNPLLRPTIEDENFGLGANAVGGFNYRQGLGISYSHEPKQRRIRRQQISLGTLADPPLVLLL